MSGITQGESTESSPAREGGDAAAAERDCQARPSAPG